MANRFIDTDIYKEEWFIDLGHKNRDFWFYLQTHCNHAGVWAPQWRDVKFRIGIDIVDPAIYGTQIKIIPSGEWFLTQFVLKQQMISDLTKLNPNNACHASIIKILEYKNIISPCVGATQPLARGYSNSNGNSTTTKQPNTSYEDSIRSYSNKNTIKMHKSEEEDMNRPITDEERAHNEAVWAQENYDTPAWRKTLGEEISTFLKIGFSKQKTKDLFLNRKVPEFIIDELMGKEF